VELLIDESLVFYSSGKKMETGANRQCLNQVYHLQEKNQKGAEKRKKIANCQR